MTRGGGGRRS
uniref:Uncharacterized protein n=1 Tax=Arundo donax TaxID=35708 RepID=A0A0A9H8E5_ARUDO